MPVHFYQDEVKMNKNGYRGLYGRCGYTFE